ncbi:MAG TPA: alkaline phosphatase PhoX, partial [Polyangia bacterium]
IRADKVGSIFALEEADPTNPHASGSFKYFAVWRGAISATDVYAAGAPDNLVVDKDGDIWFGTDGNFALQRDNPMPNMGRAHSDSYYFLNLRPDPPGALVPLSGKAFRFMSVPSDAEATGPAFTPDLRTFFSSVQHPGEEVASTWSAR